MLIAAISTAPGAGAVSIIRLSGPGALAALRRVFRPAGGAGWEPRLMRFGRIVEPDEGRLLDEGLAVWFPGPKSFTGEDCAEIQGHGGPAVTAQVLAAVLRAGARLAEPGEFTRRAFLNGRLDLAQAEAVADLVAARGAAETALAARQLAGGLSGRVAEIHQALFAALVELSADIDFSDDLEPLNLAALKDRLEGEALAPLEALLADGRAGRPFREGLRLALAGAPNVGKSSLFNALAGTDRALVSPAPGTTRDYITTEAVWDGLAVELCDTAGLSGEPVDELDALGQNRSRSRLQEADLVLWVRDSDRGPAADADFDPSLLPAGRAIVVWNKIDLAPPPAPADPRDAVCPVSVKSGAGLTGLKAAILKMATGRDEPAVPEVVPNLRHQVALGRARDFVLASLAAIDQGLPPDICVFEIRSAVDSLEAISGRVEPEDVLREIFSRFCLGK